MSSNAERKRQRRRAAQQEAARRQADTEAASPLSRAQLDALQDHLAEEIVNAGHDGTFSITTRWLHENSLPVREAIEFFEAHRLSHDFDLAVNGDAHRLFGPTPKRLARMPLEQDQLEELISWLELALAEGGCDSSFRLTQKWLKEHGHPQATTELALVAQGGGCDCEVVLNVDAESIYP